MQQKYFTEEERREAHRKASRRYYYKSMAYVSLKHLKKDARHVALRRRYWEKKAVLMGLPKEEGRHLYLKHRIATHARRAVQRERDRIHRAEYHAKYYEAHKNDPVYKERVNAAVRRWLKNHPEQAKRCHKEAYRRYRAKIGDEAFREKARDYKAKKKREERIRLTLTLGGKT